MDKLNARNFRGTRDYLPSEMIIRNSIINKIRTVFENYGFVPIETPALEYLDVLLNKYGDEASKLIYRLNYKDGNTAGLKYDLTVPLARFVNQHKDNISYPFKRYQIQPVWRADRPQPNKGRFREFYQCDADIIGTDSLVADAEIIAMTSEILASLDIGPFVIRLNNRKLLKGITTLLRLPSSMEEDFFRIVDKLDKMSKDDVKKELLGNGFEEEIIDRAFELIYLKTNSNSSLIEELMLIFRNSELGLVGIMELKEILSYLDYMNIKNIKLDLSLIRGLDYYTGSVYESSSIKLPHIGSLSGGGRYDNLLGSFGQKSICALGNTIGLDRIITLLKQLNKIENTSSLTKVLITLFSRQDIAYPIKLAKKLRDANIKTEIFFDDAKLKKQFGYADKKKIPFVLVCGPEEIELDKITVKNLNSGMQEKVDSNNIVNYLKQNI